MESMTPKPDKDNFLSGIVEDDVKELSSFFEEVETLHDVKCRWKQVLQIKEEFDD